MTALLPMPDLLAFAFFVVQWIAYTVVAEHPAVRSRSLSAVMTRHRLTWIRSMCDREQRVGDASLIANLMRSVSFFASASILILGGLVALLGSGEAGYAVFRSLPFADDTTLGAFEAKVALLACVFVYAFFQITWSLRQFNYCCVLMGSAPAPRAPAAEKDRFSAQASRLQALAANSFNRGLRAYYFALAMLAWFVGWIAFVAATALVVAVLYRREFRSKTLKALKGALDASSDPI